MNGLTFRSSRIVYYGPHACAQCGVNICKMAQGFGGNAFTYPDGPIYPNTEWHVHVCNPKDILRQKAISCQQRILAEHPEATSSQQGQLGRQIFADSRMNTTPLSGNQTFYDSEAAAWIGAKKLVFPNEGEQDAANGVIRDAVRPKPLPLSEVSERGLIASAENKVIKEENRTRSSSHGR